MSGDSERALFERARAGDRGAFGQLYETVARPLALFLYRLIAMRQDAEDLAQQTAVEAIETIRDAPAASSFRAWVFGLAAKAALDHLRGREQWHPDAQIRVAQKTASDGAIGRRLLKLHGTRLHTTYDIREHIDFCFTCMGRCLPPHEQAALLLVDLHGFPVAEAAQTLGVTAPAVEFRLDQARAALAGQFEERCTLVNKNGVCSQCAALDTLFHKGYRHTEQALFQLSVQPQPTPRERAATLGARLAIVRSVDPLRGDGARLHDALMAMTRKVNGYR